jgi:hypothetical protein
LPLEYVIFMCIFCYACEKLRIVCSVNPFKDAREIMKILIQELQELKRQELQVLKRQELRNDKLDLLLLI